MTPSSSNSTANPIVTISGQPDHFNSTLIALHYLAKKRSKLSAGTPGTVSHEANLAELLGYIGWFPRTDDTPRLTIEQCLQIVEIRQIAREACLDLPIHNLPDLDKVKRDILPPQYRLGLSREEWNAITIMDCVPDPERQRQAEDTFVEIAREIVEESKGVNGAQRGISDLFENRSHPDSSTS